MSNRSIVNGNVPFMMGESRVVSARGPSDFEMAEFGSINP